MYHRDKNAVLWMIYFKLKSKNSWCKCSKILTSVQSRLYGHKSIHYTVLSFFFSFVWNFFSKKWGGKKEEIKRIYKVSYIVEKLLEREQNHLNLLLTLRSALSASFAPTLNEGVRPMSFLLQSCAECPLTQFY